MLFSVRALHLCLIWGDDTLLVRTFKTTIQSAWIQINDHCKTWTKNQFKFKVVVLCLGIFKFSLTGQCFYHLNKSWGNFESPGKPGCYPNNKYCTWLLEAPVGQYIDLRFNSFHLEYGNSNCPWDYVEVLDGNSLHSPILVKACGQLPWWRLYSSGRFLMVQFHSDGIIGMPGFSAYYQASHNSKRNKSISLKPFLNNNV